MISEEQNDNYQIYIQKKEDENRSYTPAVQSANCLFKFLQKPEYLYQILKTGAIAPRYGAVAEDVSYLHIGRDKLYFPMICFCDIPLHKLRTHMSTYGEYGIAFSKQWGIQNKIQPIQYINGNSFLCEDFTSVFSYAMNNRIDGPLSDHLIMQLTYMKPIDGKDRDGRARNYTDDCEWRFVPDVSNLGIRPILEESQNEMVQFYNRVIEKHGRECWLQFKFQDIKYLVIPSEDKFDSLYEIIREAVPDDSLRQRVVSKILIGEHIKEDF